MVSARRGRPGRYNPRIAQRGWELENRAESMKAEPVTAGGAEVSEKERDRKRKEQTRAETEARVKKRSQTVPFGEEKRAFPSRGDRSLRQCDDALRCEQAEESCEAFWDPDQLDGDLGSTRGACIASQPLLPRKAIMRPLRPGQGNSRANWVGRESRLHLYLQALACEQLHAGPPMLPSAPVTPEQRSRPHGKGMRASGSPDVASW
jgi:hypothetical protein